MYSAAGTYLAFILGGTKYMDISPGYAWAITLINSTGADIVAGTLTVQHAPALANDPCAPDPAKWADIPVAPACDDAPGTVGGPATITISAAAPLPAGGQCSYSVPCTVGPFVRVTGTVPTGADVVGIVTRLRRSNIRLAAS